MYIQNKGLLLLLKIRIRFIKRHNEVFNLLVNQLSKTEKFIFQSMHVKGLATKMYRITNIKILIPMQIVRLANAKQIYCKVLYSLT